MFDLSALNLRSPLNTESPNYDPTAPEPVKCIAPPEEPAEAARRTSRDFDITEAARGSTWRGTKAASGHTTSPTRRT